MALAELDAQLLRRIATFVPDPHHLAASFKLAHQVVSEDSFPLEWFQHQHSLQAPNRPWQYSVIAWRRMYGATAEQLAAFIIRCFYSRRSAKQQEAKQKQLEQPAATAVPPAPAPVTKLDRYDTFEGGETTIFPDCSPLLSVVRKAEQLLKRGRAIDALFMLCPFSGALLIGYAALADNRDLVRQLCIQQVRQRLLYPAYYLTKSDCSRYIRTDVLAATAAASRGSWQLHRLLLAGLESHRQTWKFSLLRNYTARHSTAECLQDVLFITRLNRRWHALAAPEHLVMAASRIDPWAPGVVQLLLKTLSKKKLKPSFMRPAYEAACRNGNFEVLRLLLGVTARDPRWHVPMLLKAAAAAANPAVWESLLRLLLLSNSSGGDGQQQQQQAGVLQLLQDSSSSDGQQQQQHYQQAGLPQLLPEGIEWCSPPCMFLTTQVLIEVLLIVLPGLQSRSGTLSMLQLQRAKQQQRTRLLMADQFWQLLVVGLGREADVRQHLLFRQVGIFDPARILWVQQFGLPLLQAYPMAYAVLQDGMTTATRAGDFAAALQLHRVVKGLQVEIAAAKLTPAAAARAAAAAGVSAAATGAATAGSAAAAAGAATAGSARKGGNLYKADTAREVMQASLYGNLRRACAAGDAAAVAQLERLSAFADIFSTCCNDLDQPTLLRSLFGKYRGRVMTGATLAEELGLPWQLLLRLLKQQNEARHKLKFSSSSSSGDAEQLLAMHRDADLCLLKAQDAQYQALVLNSGAAVALRREMCMLFSPSLYRVAVDAAGGVGGAAAAAERLADAQAFIAVQHAAVQEQLDMLLHIQEMRQQQQQQGGDHAVGQEPPRHLQQLEKQAQHLEELSMQLSLLQQQQQQQEQELMLQGQPANSGAQPAAGATVGNAEEGYVWDLDGDRAPIESKLKVRQQLQDRLVAGEASIPLPQQQLRGPIPLWQQAILEVLSHSGEPFRCMHIEGDRMYEYLTSSLVPGGPIRQLQQILMDPGFMLGPLTPKGSSASEDEPWSFVIARAAIELQQPQLLAWSLEPEPRKRLWGTSPAAYAKVLDKLHAIKCSPISCEANRQHEQQLKELQKLQQLQQQQQQQQQEQPWFLQAAAQTGILLLQLQPSQDFILNRWLISHVGVNSSAADLARAKALLAAVAAAAEVPAGARVLTREGMRQVLLTGDLDLLALVVSWADRLEIRVHPEDPGPPGGWG